MSAALMHQVYHAAATYEVNQCKQGHAHRRSLQLPLVKLCNMFHDWPTMNVLGAEAPESRQAVQ